MQTNWATTSFPIKNLSLIKVDKHIDIHRSLPMKMLLFSCFNGKFKYKPSSLQILSKPTQIIPIFQLVYAKAEVGISYF